MATEEELMKELYGVNKEAIRLIKTFSRMKVPSMKDRPETLSFLCRMHRVHNSAIAICDRFDTIVRQVGNKDKEEQNDE